MKGGLQLNCPKATKRSKSRSSLSVSQPSSGCHGPLHPLHRPVGANPGRRRPGSPFQPLLPASPTQPCFCRFPRHLWHFAGFSAKMESTEE